MKKPLLFKLFHSLFILGIFAGLLLICSSFILAKSSHAIVCEQNRFYDTIPYTSPHIFKWGYMPKLTPLNGELIAFDGRDSLLFKRKDYEAYARENQEPEEHYRIFTKLEIEAEYPGGAKAWTNYLSKNMVYPKDALDASIQGTVVIQFIVDTDGKLSDAEAISGPTSGGLRNEAIKLVNASGDWHPGIQNFRLVRSYKKQAVTFVIN